MCVLCDKTLLTFTDFCVFSTYRIIYNQPTNQPTNNKNKQKSSVVITGVPTKDYRLPSSWIQPQTVVVNVASYKNVDEDSLLRIPGVVYVPLVGKVTVAMLERNLMRLYQQFHHPSVKYDYRRRRSSLLLMQPGQPTYMPAESGPLKWLGQLGTPLQLYTAIAVTILIGVELSRIKK